MNRLIQDIHAASLSPEQWPSVIEKIMLATNATSSHLFTPTTPINSGGFSYVKEISTEMMERYAAHYQATDLYIEAVVSKGFYAAGKLITDEDLLPHKTLIDSEYYSDFLRPAGIDRLCCSVLFDERSPPMLGTALSLYRSQGEPAFSTRDRDTLQTLIPHLSQAIGVMQRLRIADAQTAASHAVLNHLNQGIILFSRNGAVVFANTAARRMLTQRDGIALEQSAHGADKLVTTGRAAITLERLSQAIAVALRAQTPHFAEALRILRNDGTPLLLQLSPLSESNGFDTGHHHACAIAFLFDPAAAPQCNIDLLMQFYALTPAEARLVAQLCTGATLEAIAAQRRLSLATLKTQLRSAFEKTGTHRQAELIKLALSLPPLR